jgi:hypothetical protein
MPGTVKSGLLSDADRSHEHKCGGQEKVCWMQALPLDKGHFITEVVCLAMIMQGNHEAVSKLVCGYAGQAGSEN